MHWSFFSFSGKNGSSFLKYSISHLKSNLLPLLTICSLIIIKMPIWHIYPLLPWQREHKATNELCQAFSFQNLSNCKVWRKSLTLRGQRIWYLHTCRIYLKLQVFTMSISFNNFKKKRNKYIVINIIAIILNVLPVWVSTL